MKRVILLALLAAVALTSLLLAQSAGQATLRTSGGDKPVTYFEQSGAAFFSAAEIIAALGGSLVAEGGGFRVTLSDVQGAFGPDSRFAVVRDDLIEMPAAPMLVEGQAFVPWQFFDGLLARGSPNEMSWDATARVLSVRPRQSTAVSGELAVTDLQGITKIVITLSGVAEYAIAREESAYIIRFRTPVNLPFTEQSYHDPHVARAVFNGNNLRIQLQSPDIAGDAYKLDQPFRIVLDLRKGAPGAAGAPSPPLPPPRAAEPAGIRTIVIDPGHGGKEVGAVGPNGLMEKDITLALSQRLAATLAKQGMRVILTRDEDSQVSLDQRTAMANQYKADLFLSVHVNAAVVKGAKGSETYFLSLEASDELARRAAETENAASQNLQSGAASDLRLILWDLAQQEYLQESSRFAQAVQEELNKVTGVSNRGVKQAPFKVLVGATMPAALVEVGFISNPEEEAKLRSDAHQGVIIEALTRAVQRYKGEYETRIGLNNAPQLSGGPASTAAIPPAQKSRTGT